eukprot:scaffold53243_cov62-Phaeocystis_antarctica.AAC.1
MSEQGRGVRRYLSHISCFVSRLTLSKVYLQGRGLSGGYLRFAYYVPRQPSREPQGRDAATEWVSSTQAA